MNISHKHVLSWNAHVLEDAITVVLGDEAKLGANVTNFYSR